jgi:UDP-N-acetylmuramoyl-tripeptide--D-alanyl-D-alanine ligase
MMALSEVTLATKGCLTGRDATFVAVTTDSRKAAAGDLFVALRGERFDGHDFVAQCFERGVAAAMVERQSSVVSGQSSVHPMLAVDDTRLGLGDLAGHWRRKFVIPLAAVTGSNGKTTVKEMLASILRTACGADGVLATEGNLNNDIGLPLTLLKLRDSHRYAVIEMGMNQPGEIAYLTRIARPTVALVNNAGAAHLQGLGSVQAVAQAKGEIFAGLGADGIAVINADDAAAPLWRQLAAPRRVLTFGLEQPADVSAGFTLHADGSELQLNTPQGDIAVLLAVPGRHNVNNALAAATAALAMNVPLSAVAAGLASFSGVKGRLQTRAGCCGAVVIDDTYNANPASMRAAIGVLANMPGKRIFVIGDMGELGADAVGLHREIGAAAKAAGLEALFALGELSRNAASAFGTGASHFDSAEALAAALLGELTEGTAVLVKGSRFMRMERVVDMLTQKENSPCC